MACSHGQETLAFRFALIASTFACAWPSAMEVEELLDNPEIQTIQKTGKGNTLSARCWKSVIGKP